MKGPKRIPSAADRVHALLVARGAAEHVVKGGIGGLVRSWERTARAYERGVDSDLDELRNDLDARQILAGVLLEVPDGASEAELVRIEAADERVRAHATLEGPCVWGSVLARKERWTRSANWWYFARPRKLGAELERELDALRPSRRA